MQNTFINIFINGNSMSDKELLALDRGYVAKRYNGKLLTNIDQTEILVNSIQQSWSFPNRIHFIHSYPLKEADRIRLSKYGIHILHRPSNSKHKGLAFATRDVSYLEPDERGTHRLILDSDMIALREPKFNFDYDVQAIPGKSMFDVTQWKKICGYAGCELPDRPVNREIKGHCMYTRYMRGATKDFFPYFNHGAILVKEELADTIGRYFIQYRDKLYNKIPHYHGQVAIGLAIHSATKNWGVFDRGFNVLSTMEEVAPFELNKITLYHYLGKRGGKRLKRYERFFKGIV